MDEIDAVIENFCLGGGGITDCGFVLLSGDDLQETSLLPILLIDTMVVD